MEKTKKGEKTYSFLPFWPITEPSPPVGVNAYRSLCCEWSRNQVTSLAANRSFIGLVFGLGREFSRSRFLYWIIGVKFFFCLFVCLFIFLYFSSLLCLSLCLLLSFSLSLSVSLYLFVYLLFIYLNIFSSLSLSL